MNNGKKLLIGVGAVLGVTALTAAVVSASVPGGIATGGTAVGGLALKIGIVWLFFLI